MLRIRAAALALLFLTNTAHAQSRAAIVSKIDSLVDAYMKAAPIASLSLAVVRGTDTLVMRGYGEADLTTKRRAGTTTVYEIGSLTKQFTAAAIHRLAERGAVKLDADMSTYLPNFPMHGHRVSVRQLLNHTSGIHSYTSVQAWQSTWAQDLSPDSIVGFVARDTFDFAPGTRYAYNNTGYVLLGMIVEKASGKSYAKYLTDEFFTPLGLKQTSYCPNHPTDTTFANGYSVRNAQLMPATYLSLTHPFAAGALCSTVRDFGVWQRALHTGKVVGAASYASMTRPDTLTNGRRITYGNALDIGRLGKRRMISHTGGINGFATAAAWFPEDGLSIVAFTNIDARSPVTLMRDIALAVYGMAPAPSVPPRQMVPLDSTLRKQIGGTYVFDSNEAGISRIRMLVEGTRLFVQGDGLTDAYGGPVEAGAALGYLGDNTFGSGFDMTFRLKFVNEGGQMGVTLTQNGASLRGKRMP